MMNKPKSLNDAPDQELESISRNVKSDLTNIVQAGQSKKWQGGVLSAGVALGVFGGISLLVRRIGSRWFRFSPEEVSMATVISGVGGYEAENIRQKVALKGKFGLAAESILKDRARAESAEVHEPAEPEVSDVKHEKMADEAHHLEDHQAHNKHAHKVSEHEHKGKIADAHAKEQDAEPALAM
jgi:hypothetical protein